MTLVQPSELFLLQPGDCISKPDLYSLIIDSKKEDSVSWEGYGYRIGNTPQQGINWIGQLPDLKGVIIRTKDKAYGIDGWENEERLLFNYSFKARHRHDGNGGEINYEEKANQVLLNQSEYGYPILLFSESQGEWLFEGSFCVVQQAEKFVTLELMGAKDALPEDVVRERYFIEGGAKLRTHLKIERSRAAVAALKGGRENVCDICKFDFERKYGVSYIEAHHKQPLAKKLSREAVSLDDFALLCPNCHRAVHLYLANDGVGYEEIKKILLERI